MGMSAERVPMESVVFKAKVFPDACTTGVEGAARGDDELPTRESRLSPAKGAERRRHRCGLGWAEEEWRSDSDASECSHRRFSDWLAMMGISQRTREEAFGVVPSLTVGHGQRPLSNAP